MKRSPTVGIVVTIVILISVFIIYSYFWGNRFSDVPIEGIPEELINTEREAIEYAKQDEEFMSRADSIATNFRIEYMASWYKEKGVWIVSVYAADVTDVGYGMDIKPDGTITNRGTWAV